MKITEIEAIVKTGDFFICSAKPKAGLFGWLTRRIALSEFVHAGVLAYSGRNLNSHEMRIKGDYAFKSGYIVEPFERRAKTLLKQYQSVYLIRPRGEASEQHIIETLKGFEGVEYGWLRIISLTFNWNGRANSAVCSTVCERVAQLMGQEVHAFHPSDVLRSGKLITQIL